MNVNSGIFQQDGASCHTANIVKAWLDFVNVDYIKDWLGNSPDLNPIKSLSYEEVRARMTNPHMYAPHKHC